MSAQTVVDIGRKLDLARRKYGVMSLSAGASDIKAAEKVIDELDKLVARFDALVSPPPGDPDPTILEKVAVLTIALERIANRDGAVISPTDTSLAAVVDACPTPDAARFWAKQHAVALFGLVTQEKKLAEELRVRGVLLWGDSNDWLTRLVNTSWLTAHADIFKFVTGDKPSGHRCRFCRLPEPHGSIAPAFIEVATPEGDWKRGKLPIPRSVQAHPQCAPFWLEWVDIARQYQSEEEANAADIAAGRTQGAVPALPAPLPEPAVEPMNVGD